MDYDLTFTQQEIDEGKGLAGVAYLTFIGFLVALIAGKENRFVMYHVQQALILYLVLTAGSFLAIIPFLGCLVILVVWVFAIVCVIIGATNGFGGKVVPLPIIGQWGLKFNLVKPSDS